MGKPLTIGRSIRITCQACGQRTLVPLVLNCDEVPVTCQHCGETACTMGDAVDATVSHVCDVFRKGLERRARGSEGRR